MIIAKENELLDIYQEQVETNTQGVKEDFPFGYTNRAGDFVEDLSAYIELMSPINTLIQNSIQEIKTSEKEILETNNKIEKIRKELKLLPKKNKAKNAKIKKDLISLHKVIAMSKQSIKGNKQSITKEKIDSLIITEVKKKTNTKLGDTEILNTFKPMYVKAKKSSEGERTRDVKVKPKVEGEKYIPTEEELKVINRTQLKYEDRDIELNDKSKFVQIMLREIVPTPTVEEIENAWKKLLAGEDMGFDSIEELKEIKANYDKEDSDPEIRKTLIRLARNGGKGKKTIKKTKYDTVFIKEFGQNKNPQRLIFINDDKMVVRPFSKASGSLIISMTEFKKHINNNIFPQLEISINTWIKNNGYNSIPLSNLLSLVENLFLGTTAGSLEGNTNADFYDNIWEMQSDIKSSVNSNVDVGTILDKIKIETINKSILKDLDLKNNFSLQQLGTIMVQRPVIEDTILRDKVIKFLDTPVNEKTYGYFILRAVTSKVPYKLLLREEKPKRPYVVEDTTYQQSLLGKAEELKKALEELNSKQKRKVKTYLQDADPTEYFGEEYLKLGKLINILDEVEGSTGELEGLEEDNLKMIKVAASLRKKYENLYRKLREKIYPEDEEE